MRKKVFGKQLSMETGTRRALYRALVRALALNGSIKTTKAKAKAVQGFVDKLITKAKKEDVPSRRRLYAKLGNDRETASLLAEISKNTLGDIKSGYTRMTALPRRKGDLAEVVRLEWTKKPEAIEKGKSGKSEAKTKLVKPENKKKTLVQKLLTSKKKNTNKESIKK